MTTLQLAYVIGLLALTDDPRQLAALGRFIGEAFPDDAATPVLLRNVRRRVRQNGAPVSSISEHRGRFSTCGEGGEGGEAFSANRD